MRSIKAGASNEWCASLVAFELDALRQRAIIAVAKPQSVVSVATPDK